MDKTIYEPYFPARFQVAQVSCCSVDCCARLQELDRVVEVRCTEDMGQGVGYSKFEEDMRDREVTCVEALRRTEDLGVEGPDGKQHHWLIFQRKMMGSVLLVLYAAHATNRHGYPQRPQSHLQR
jgi:hypothetical protein